MGNIEVCGEREDIVTKIYESIEFEKLKNMNIFIFYEFPYPLFN